MFNELENNVRFLVELERQRQKDLGFDGYHDDMHTRGELASAAAYFILPGSIPLGPVLVDPLYILPEEWQNAPKIHRSTAGDSTMANRTGAQLETYLEERIRDLVKGIACAIAECERLQRVAGVQDPESLPSGV